MTSQRLQILLSHLNPATNPPLTPNFTSSAQFAPSPDTSLSQSLASFRASYFPAEFHHARDITLALIRNNPHIYYVDHQHSPKQKKEMTHLQFQHFCKSGILSVQRVNEDLFYFLGVLDAISIFDTSLLGKIVIHYQLFGSCLWRVGTERQRHVLEDVDAGVHTASFCMTEVGHGSNVQALETEAHYDPSTKEFILHTPCDSATKMWAGNVALYGTLTIVFAQLIVNGKNHGVHAFLLQIRDPRNLARVTPGVIIKDLGVKNAWRGVDNSLVRFNKVRVPRENLLNRFADVTEDGTYVTSIKNGGERFGKTLAALLFGRLLYIVGPTANLQASLTVAIRYACQRKQFGDPRVAENYIWDYPSHRLKLVPPLANAFAFYFASTVMSKEFATLNDETLHDFHTFISSVKAYVCEYTPLQLARNENTCGGHGFHTDSRLGEFHMEQVPFQIAEGDSIVLYQQTARALLNQLMKGFQKSGPGAAAEIAKASAEQYGDLSVVDNGLGAENKLLSTQSLLNLLSKRFTQLLLAAGARMMQLKKSGKSNTDAWTGTLELALDVARSYVEFHLACIFVRELRDKSKDSTIRPTLMALFDVFLISLVNDHLGFHLSEENITPAEGKQLSRARSALITENDAFDKSHILSIVNSFQIPDYILRASIGRSNMDYVGNLMDLAQMPRTRDVERE